MKRLGFHESVAWPLPSEHSPTDAVLGAWCLEPSARKVNRCNFDFVAAVWIPGQLLKVLAVLVWHFGSEIPHLSSMSWASSFGSSRVRCQTWPSGHMVAIHLHFIPFTLWISQQSSNVLRGHREVNSCKFPFEMSVSIPSMSMISYGHVPIRSQLQIHWYPGWWFGCHQLYFPIYWECHHPNGLSYFSIFFRGVAQPPTRIHWYPTMPVLWQRNSAKRDRYGQGPLGARPSVGDPTDPTLRAGAGAMEAMAPSHCQSQQPKHHHHIEDI